MLLALSIQDFVIVDRLRLEFLPGFTALTGETGAGKSILVDALLLVLGGRADASVVRAGRDRAEITAEFDVGDSTSARECLAAADLATDEGECILRRVIDAGGRSRAFVNGRAVTVAQLREIGERLVDIHGQHEHQSLMRSDEQRALLDGFAAANELAAAVARAYDVRANAEKALRDAEAGARSLEDEQDRLAWQVGELRDLDVAPGEWEQIQAEQGRLAHSAALVSGAEHAIEVFLEGDAAVASVVGALGSRLRELAAHDPDLAPVADLVDSAEIQIKEAAYALRHYRQRLDLDPERLSEIESRMEAIVSLARKHRVPPGELVAHRADLEGRLASLSARLDLEALAADLAGADEYYRAAAALLTAARRKGARALGKAVTAAMQDLAMAGGTFEVALRELDAPSASGMEQVEFRMAGHPGVPVAPVSRVASGGELARLSLAIQSVTSRITPVPTLVFDEVDAGIGGGVAEIVGQMLRKLGARHQVFCVTHLPQVASAAVTQWRVSKRVEKGQTRSVVEQLDQAGRIEEIARMLGGVELTETTRRHAAEMLSKT